MTAEKRVYEKRCKRIADALAVLAEEWEYITSVDSRWRGVAVENVMRQWDRLDPDSDVWQAAAEVIRNDHVLDLELSDAVVRLLVAMFDGHSEAADEDGITFDTAKRMIAASAAICLGVDRAIVQVGAPKVPAACSR